MVFQSTMIIVIVTVKETKDGLQLQEYQLLFHITKRLKRWTATAYQSTVNDKAKTKNKKLMQTFNLYSKETGNYVNKQIANCR